MQITGTMFAQCTCVRAVATVLLLLSLACLPASVAGGTDIHWNVPEVYRYRDRLGATEHYIVVRYEVVNSEQVVRLTETRLVVTTAEGVRLSDGFRPLVQASFCLQTGCQAEALRSTAEIVGRRIQPGGRLPGLAIFRVPGTVPAQVMLRAGEGRVAAYEVDPELTRFTPIERAAKVTEPSTTADLQGQDRAARARPMDLAATRPAAR